MKHCLGCIPMSLSDYVKEEKLKHDILSIVRTLLNSGPYKINLDLAGWDHVVNKMMEEWKDADRAKEVMEDSSKWVDLRRAAKDIGITPEDMLVRLKLMFFIAKSEIMRFQIREMRALLDEYRRLLDE